MGCIRYYIFDIEVSFGVGVLMFDWVFFGCKVNKF